MFYAFQNMAHKSWSAWSGMFDFLPYGDNIVAGAALFFIAIVTCKLVADGRI